MKYIILLCLSVLFCVTAAQAQKKIQVDSFYVSGNCDACMERIENAADIRGVRKASWNKYSKVLTVTYRTGKCTKEMIQDAVLRVGHDVDTFKAEEQPYNELPSCCAYRSEDAVTH